MITRVDCEAQAAGDIVDSYCNTKKDWFFASIINLVFQFRRGDTACRLRRINLDIICSAGLKTRFLLMLMNHRAGVLVLNAHNECFEWL
jgi:hypothetical protein